MHTIDSSAMSKWVALIPAAGPVHDGIVALSNVSSPAMIPVAGRPVIHWTLDHLQSLGVRRFRIAVPRRGLFLEEFVEASLRDGASVEFVLGDPAGGVGDTVRALLPSDPGDAYLVVLGDTMFRFAEPAAVIGSQSPTVLVSEVEESYRWCIARVDESNRVTSLEDKVAGLEGDLQAVVGVYAFPDGAVLHRTCAATAAAGGRRTQMSDLLGPLVGDGQLRAVAAGEWLDCGNPDRQVVAQRTLLAQRAFNEIEIDPVLGTLTKRSTDRAKFLNEIDYLRLLPTDLQPLFPRVLRHTTDWDAPAVTMEFYGYPTLAELFLFENLDQGVWRRIFRHLEQVLERMAAHQRPVAASACRAMFLGKVLDRLEGIGHPDIAAIVSSPDDLRVGERTVPGWSRLVGQLEAAVDKLATRPVGGVIHGDLCFSNVLYDVRSGLLKLIDPRGSFGNVGIHGDQRYDVAKLFHSVVAGYDFVTADLFSVEGSVAAGFSLELRHRQAHQRAAEAFAEVFFPRFDRAEITLVTGLIFLGLPALHYDHPGRQLAFFLRGLELVHDALDDLDGVA